MGRRVVGFLGFLTMAGCTAVLGIHSAELDDNGGGLTQVGMTKAASTCTRVASGCSDCLSSSCASETATCLADSECRRAIDSYATCIGSDCVDDGLLCVEKLTGPAQDLGGCMVDHCSTACSDGAPYEKCELYCSCMGNLCPSQLKNNLGGASCLENCRALAAVSPRDVDCRWTHCEYARIDATLHCPHAIAMPVDVCNGVPAPQRHVCAAGQESGFPCDVDGDCCSKSCVGGVCK